MSHRGGFKRCVTWGSRWLVVMTRIENPSPTSGVESTGKQADSLLREEYINPPFQRKKDSFAISMGKRRDSEACSRAPIWIDELMFASGSQIKGACSGMVLDSQIRGS